MARKPTKSPEKRRDADRRVRQADRLGRVLRILELLQGHGRWNAASLAAELECSERTVHRYLDILKYAGIPFWFAREKNGYELRPGVQFPSMNLSEEELLGQSLATQLASAPSLDAGAGAQATTRKLLAVSDERAARLLSEAGRLITVLDLNLADHRGHRATIEAIQWALLKSRQLTGRYESPYEAKPRQVTLHPYRLCLVRQAWYLIARPTREDEPKTYRVARFHGLRMIDNPAEVPKDFDIGAYFGNAWSVFRGQPTYEVELRFSPEAAKQVSETRWHHTQQAKPQKDGSVAISFTVDGLDEILWWLLGWAGFVKVERPEALRARFADQLQAALDANGVASPSETRGSH